MMSSLRNLLNITVLFSKSVMFSVETYLNPYIPCFQSPTTHRLGSERIIRQIISWLAFVSWNSSIIRYLNLFSFLAFSSLYRRTKANMALRPKVRRLSMMLLRMKAR